MKVSKKIERKLKQISIGETFKYAQLGIEPSEYNAAAKTLERLITQGTIKRVAKGMFYKPKQSPFGELQPREEELLKPYLFKEGKRVAYITGTLLYNRMGLTTQVPKIVNVASREKRIRAQIETLKVKPVKSYVDVTDQNYYLLELLDVLKDFKQIPDLDKEAGLDYLKGKIDKLSDKDTTTLIKYALKYPPRVRAFLGALLTEEENDFKVGDLKKSLNPLTQIDLGISELLATALAWNIR